MFEGLAKLKRKLQAKPIARKSFAWHEAFRGKIDESLAQFDVEVKRWSSSEQAGGQELHEALLLATQDLMRPSWSQQVLQGAWDVFDKDNSGYIDAKENQLLIGSYLTSFAYWFPIYVERLYAAYKTARLAVQAARIAASVDDNETSIEEFNAADAEVIRALRLQNEEAEQEGLEGLDLRDLIILDDVPIRPEDSVEVKFGLEESNGEVRQLLSEGIDDELKMRLATLKKANETVLLHVSNIADEAFRLMDLNATTKIAQWELLEAFELAINTATELILLRAEAESTQGGSYESEATSIQASIRIISKRIRSNSEIPSVSNSNSNCSSSSSSNSCRNANSTRYVTHNQVGPESINALEARIRIKQQEELGRRRSVEVQTVLKQTKAATNLKNLGFM